MRGKIFKKEAERAVVARKTEASKKRSKFLEGGGKNFTGGVANLRSAPGGRHPSYATVQIPIGFTDRSQISYGLELYYGGVMQPLCRFWFLILNSLCDSSHSTYHITYDTRLQSTLLLNYILFTNNIYY